MADPQTSIEKGRRTKAVYRAMRAGKTIWRADPGLSEVRSFMERENAREMVIESSMAERLEAARAEVAQ